MDITEQGNERFFSEHDYIVSKTDLSGKITYANQTFIDMAEYSEEELLGAPHNIIRHEDMPRYIFKVLWDKVKNGEEIFAYVKNRTKTGKFYWVHAYVSPEFDPHTNKIIGYHSARRSPNKEAVKIVESIYKKMITAEKSGGMEASAKILQDELASKKVTYEQFILAYE